MLIGTGYCQLLLRFARPRGAIGDASIEELVEEIFPKAEPHTPPAG